MPDIQNILPEKKFKAYLSVFGVSNTKEMFSNTITQCFLLMIHDFKSGIISLDELSAMSRELLWRIQSLETNITDTSHALECIDDLYYDLRIIQDKNMGEWFIENLKETLDYYDKYEYVINKILIDKTNKY